MTIINKLPNEYTCINNLLLCNSLQHVKKYLYYWKLTKEYSKKFYYNIDFQKCLNQKNNYL